MNHNKIMNGSAIKRSASVDTLDDGSVQGKRARVASTKKRENTHLDQKPRVGCPFYQKDPITHHKTTSCRGRGFCEMAKLKDHLKDIHRLPKRTIESLNFKGATFNKLRTIEEKWTQVFKILFPKVHHDDIPPPITPICSSDPKSHFLPARSEEPALGEFNLRTFSSNLRYILLKNYGHNLRAYVPQLVDGFEDMFDEALKMTQYPRAWAEEASNKYIESFDGLYMVTQQIDISIGGLQRSVDMSSLPFPTVSVEETDFTEGKKCLQS
ncbi:hypothetical protein B0J11DRAFT_124279 [Dendryphion nanum]|uniref:Uncharacterized protein n=1 Tax=Dendryphion nanum TaxID=256645 RepID=A0A9P9ICR2_9PLEO|nr:hypothetical protein B0J11DRAFT_124279 [Dendryphion nanum]